MEHQDLVATDSDEGAEPMVLPRLEVKVSDYTPDEIERFRLISAEQEEFENSLKSKLTSLRIEKEAMVHTIDGIKTSLEQLSAAAALAASAHRKLPKREYELMRQKKKQLSFCMEKLSEFDDNKRAVRVLLNSSRSETLLARTVIGLLNQNDRPVDPGAVPGIAQHVEDAEGAVPDELAIVRADADDRAVEPGAVPGIAQPVEEAEGACP